MPLRSPDEERKYRARRLGMLVYLINARAFENEGSGETPEEPETIVTDTGETIVTDTGESIEVTP